MTMFDSIANVNDYLSEHWLAEVFPSKLRDLAATWKELAAKGKETPVRGLATLNGAYLTQLASLPERTDQQFTDLVTQMHQTLLRAVGFDASPTELATSQAETPINVPLLGRFSSPTSADALHILQAVPVDSVDAMLGDEGRLLVPITLAVTSEKTEKLESASKAISQLFVSDDPPRYLLVLAGSAVLVTDAARWSEGRYLAFDVATALDRRDDKATGELAFHAGLWSADVLLPNDDGNTTLDAFTEDSEKHAVGVSEDLREGLRISIEKIANEVLNQRRANGEPVEGILELPRDLTTQSLRFLYRILFLLFAEARPELGILPVGAPEYGSGYGLDRLREIIQVPLTGSSAEGRHLHESLNLLFRLVNDGHNADTTNGDGLVFEAMRSDLFDKKRTPLIDEAKLSNRVLQEVLTLLLLSKPSKNRNKQRGYISYAQLGINQLGAVYEGLMSYSGLIAEDDMVEVAKDGDADRGSWLVPSVKSGDYDEKDLVWREDRLTGRKYIVRHPKGSFVFRLSGRDRQRSASYYTPEVLTKTVVKHALAELITDETKAEEILKYRICEPALGSGAFLNEAINQLATEYLNRRQEELRKRVDPEDYTTELQRVKAYIALHRSYGVDFNSTAVELAEVSLWLNVMHQGLQAPWFGLHLRRGNSLVGARRATYDFTSLGRAKKSWLKTPPTSRPLSEGLVGDGEIHHFLLPAEGWGSVADAKRAKGLVPEATAALKKWRNDVCKKPTAKQLDRLRALSRRVERLWDLTLRRLEISEREIARHIDVWGAEGSQTTGAITREAVERELLDPEGPYMRLRLAMDAWCALWFWPLGVLTDRGHQAVIEPPPLNAWITALEGLLGAAGITKGSVDQGMFYESIDSFDELSKFDDLERQFSAMLPVWKLLADNPWLGLARNIADSQGFFHWELDFAHVFKDGGFDLQVGNPPWVRPQWREEDILSDLNPVFALADNIDTDLAASITTGLMAYQANKEYLCSELSAWAGNAGFLGSALYYSDLVGSKVNLYMNFMCATWRHSSVGGVVGLLHPESHFLDPVLGKLRSNTYKRLRRHWEFVNTARLFVDISNKVRYGIHIYGAPSKISFRQCVELIHPDTLELSLQGSATGEIPGIQYPWGGWDTRPHKARISHVDGEVLSQWSKLFDPIGTPPDQARLVRPVTSQHIGILAALAEQETRLADVGYRWTLCWDEAKAKRDKHIRWEATAPSSWNDVVLQGPHMTVATPLVRFPNNPCRSNKDWTLVDIETLPDDAIPMTNYRRSPNDAAYHGGYLHWDGSSPLEYWRLAWRSMTQPGLERSLHSAILPPGPAHVGTIFTGVIFNGEASLPRYRLAENARNTVLTAGLWASIPYDYLIKVSGQTHVHSEFIDRFPAPFEHPLSESLLLRTLRMNCMTREFASFWSALYGATFGSDCWASADVPHCSLLNIHLSEWDDSTPLRTELDRRGALVEMDAIVALMLGLTADQLSIMYRTQFPVLRKYEFDMYFDAKGRKISKEHHAQGTKQRKDDFALLQAYLNGEDSGDLLDRYEPFPADDCHDEAWFYKPDREVEMRGAYAEFERRLAST